MATHTSTSCQLYLALGFVESELDLICIEGNFGGKKNELSPHSKIPPFFLLLMTKFDKSGKI
jgi:hypothetical protein